MESVGGAPGNLGAFGNLLAGGVNLPFGGGEAYRELQRQNRPGAPGPTPVSPTRVFPPSAPGREGAIDVRATQAFGNFPGAAGNLGGLQLSQLNQYPSTNVYYDEKMKQFVPRSGGTPMPTPVKNYPGLGIAPRVPPV